MTNLSDYLENIEASRARLPAIDGKKSAEEGGCGVTGFISSVPISGRHIFEPSVQMHNRGNGKGGGIAAVGLSPKDLGVTQDVLDTNYMLQVALLDTKVGPKMEKEFIKPYLEISQAGLIPHVADYRDIKGLDVRPPDVMRYFVRVKENVLGKFMEDNGLTKLNPSQAEDEFIFQNSYRLNHQFYASLGEKQAFVLSHGRNIMILKIVGYAELVATYYQLESFKAHGWIAHQRYPTKGRVWHPGGAHPFIGLDEALVHNGDFANYHAITEYLKQHSINPQFLTDTEVSVLLFDLWNRNFGYPLEYIIEALAPTTEHDFDRLPEKKQRIYRYIQQNHIHCSPDGPWFFIIARNDVRNKELQLIGITDTAMLRPQVFAMQEGDVQIGLVCSEKQAIDATLQSLAAEDSRFCPIADKYWNARGGSATDGGAFIFTVKDSGKGDGSKALTCTNKFGDLVNVGASAPVIASHVRSPGAAISSSTPSIESCRNLTDVPHINFFLPEPVVRGKPGGADGLPSSSVHVNRGKSEGTRAPSENSNISPLSLEGKGARVIGPEITQNEFDSLCNQIVEKSSESDDSLTKAIETLTYLNDIRLPLGGKLRRNVLHTVRVSLTKIFDSVSTLSSRKSSAYRHIDWDTRKSLRAPASNESVLVLNGKMFQPEGEDADARLIVKARELGWKQFIAYGYKGQRFCGCGLANDSADVRIDVYDSSGDYLASGIDGLQIYVHGNAQDQVGQIMKQGKLVIYGDVGQTFMYGAKGGDVYVMGNAAGRPLINAVGHPRVVINGTCLDYLAESFMAGDPLNGGGFVILNGIALDDNGHVIEQEPYPGSNLFSLASGGAIFMRDPYQKVVEEQLNGGEFATLTDNDWALILPYLQENERLFGIRIDDLLTVNGVKKNYAEVYRKVQAVKLDVLMAKIPVRPSTTAYAGVIPEGEDADE